MTNDRKGFAALIFSLSCLLCTAQAGEIIRITAATRNLVPKGKCVDAIDGDWIMKNDKVVVVIGDAVLGREANMRVQSIQGAVIDFTTLADNRDYLAAFFPQGFPAPDSRRNPALLANRIEIVKGKGSEIVLRVTRDPTDKIAYESVTVYTLRDGEDFLRVTTTYTNRGPQDVSLTFGDKLRMDMDIEREASPLGKTNLAFMYNNWFGAAYAIYCPDGLLITEKPKLGSDPATGLLVGFQNPRNDDSPVISLAPGESIAATRFLLYGKDVAEIQRKAMHFEKRGPAVTTLKVTDTNSKPIEGVFVDIYNHADELVSFGITNAVGVTEIPLPQGSYRYRAFKVGHDSTLAEFKATRKPSVVPVTMNPLTHIRFSVKEAESGRMLPAKVEFKGIDGQSDPYLGSPKRAEGANNLYYSIKKEFDVPVPPGKYLITVSHGPEYNPESVIMDIKTGETKSVDVELKRAFTSPGWIMADFHNHSARSGDNDTETRSRIINLAGSGMEFAPATEHNRLSSYTDEIKDLGLETYIASAPGVELTGPTGVDSGPNHQNGFPLTVQEGKQGGGFPGISADVYTQMKGLYDYDKDKIKYVQHNHPGNGMPRLFFDKDQDGELDEGIGTRGFTDAIEIQNYIYDILNVTSDDEENKRAPVFYWLQMLNQGDRIFGTMTSDNHYVGERGGLRFVYVRSKNDDPQALDATEIALAAKNGHMVMSNGPFLKVDANGHLPGEEFAAAPGQPVIMNVEAYANSQVEIDRIQVLIDGRQDPKLNFTRESSPELFRDQGLQFKHSFPLSLKADANVIVVATGKRKPLEVALTRESRLPIPIAVANPLFVDVNGDGFVPSRDTLGQPLPVVTERPRRQAGGAE